MVESKGRSFPPEVELLLCCPRTSVGPDKTQKVRRLVQEGLDSSFLLETASRHGVLALLFRNLNTTAPEAMPQPFMARLRKFFHFNSAHNQFLAKELIDLLHHFRVDACNTAAGLVIPSPLHSTPTTASPVMNTPRDHWPLALSLWVAFQRQLAQLEREARGAQRGLWADPHAVPPWEWRVMRKRYR